MKLKRLLAGLDTTVDLPTGMDLEITGIADDSRKVQPGYLFVAIRGLAHDGHDFISQAVNKGAVAVVYQDREKYRWQNPRLLEGGGIIGIECRNSRRLLGLLWSAWYRQPAKHLKVIGVTGTDGKTTTANLIYHLLRKSGARVGLISTINALIDDASYDTGFHVTNPEPELLQKFLSLMVEKGMEYAVLEVTSHGIDQERIAGVDFEIALITNVTHEHLDYHKSFESYLKAKSRLFENVRFSILNRDDVSYDYLRKAATGDIVTYGINSPCDFTAQRISLHSTDSSFTISPGEKKVALPLPGIYNVYNCLAAISAVSKLGLSPDDTIRYLSSFRGLEGRFELIEEAQPFRVIIDFAHTPNALEQVLTQVSKFKIPGTRIICVFGCAGERDREKRPMMGEVSGRLAEMTILTAEDPRREDVDDIIKEIAAGCTKAGAEELKLNNRKRLLESDGGPKSKHLFIRVPDRSAAVKFAIEAAHLGDLIIITGKGHEKSMCFGTTEYPWSDQETTRQLLRELRANR